jgi:hypothetical protein
MGVIYPVCAPFLGLKIYESGEIRGELRQSNDETVIRSLYLCSMKIIHEQGFTIILCLLLTACGPDKDTIIQQKVTARIAEFEKKKKEECRKGLLDEAESIVDSLLLAEAQAQLRDSLNRARPFKPVQPPAVPPIDSLEIKPIFKKG